MAKDKSKNVGKFAGIPYDWRRPNMKRFKSRVWNSKAPLVNPKWWGWGYDLNLYIIFHPIKSRRNSRNVDTRQGQ